MADVNDGENQHVHKENSHTEGAFGSHLASLAEAALKSAVVFSAVFAFFCAPFIQFVPPSLMYDVGGKLALFAGITYFVVKMPYTHWIITVVFSIAPIVTGCLFFSAGFAAEAVANQNLVSNNGRCLAIQRDMLSAQPRRADGPDLFQALGCRVQGVGGVFAKPTRLERAARHPLLNGGRR